METIYDHVDKKTADEFMRKHAPEWIDKFDKLPQENHYLLIMLLYCKLGKREKAREYFPKLTDSDQSIFEHYLYYPFEKAEKIRA